MRRYLQCQYKPIRVITMLYVNQYQKVSIVALCIDIVNTFAVSGVLHDNR